MSMTPRRALTWSTRSLYVTCPLAAFTLLSWLFRWHTFMPAGRPFAALMVFQVLLLVTVGAACVALLAACHLAIHDAFSAGYRTGTASAWGDDEQLDGGDGQDPVLRLLK